MSVFAVKGRVCSRGVFFVLQAYRLFFCLLVVAPGVQSEQGTDGQWLCDAVY